MAVNMSYCRFENTERALQECLDALRYEGMPESDTEVQAAKKLFKKFLEFCCDVEIIQEIDTGAFEDLLGVSYGGH